MICSLCFKSIYSSCRTLIEIHIRDHIYMFNHIHDITNVKHVTYLK